MKAHSEKYNLLITTDTQILLFFNIRRYKVNNCKKEKFTGIKLDTKLSFGSHSPNISKKACQTLQAYTTINNHMELGQRKCFIKTFIIFIA